MFSSQERGASVSTEEKNEEEDKDTLTWKEAIPQNGGNWIMTDRYETKKRKGAAANDVRDVGGTITRWDGTEEKFNSNKKGKVSQKLPKVRMPRQADANTDRKAFGGGEQIYVKSIRSKGGQQVSEVVSIKKKFRTPRGETDVSTDSGRKSGDRISGEFIIKKIKNFEAKAKAAQQESQNTEYSHVEKSETATRPTLTLKNSNMILGFEN